MTARSGRAAQDKNLAKTRESLAYVDNCLLINWFYGFESGAHLYLVCLASITTISCGLGCQGRSFPTNLCSNACSNPAISTPSDDCRARG